MSYQENLLTFAAATNGEIFDPDYKDGTWMYRIIETQETIDNYENAAGGWNEYQGKRHGKVAGLPFLSFKSMQCRKGDQRDSLSVVDFGDRRIVIHGVDLSCF
jgi:hypothetical protein